MVCTRCAVQDGVQQGGTRAGYYTRAGQYRAGQYRAGTLIKRAEALIKRALIKRVKERFWRKSDDSGESGDSKPACSGVLPGPDNPE